MYYYSCCLPIITTSLRLYHEIITTQVFATGHESPINDGFHSNDIEVLVDVDGDYDKDGLDDDDPYRRGIYQSVGSHQEDPYDDKATASTITTTPNLASVEYIKNDKSSQVDDSCENVGFTPSENIIHDTTSSGQIDTEKESTASTITTLPRIANNNPDGNESGPASYHDDQVRMTCQSDDQMKKTGDDPNDATLDHTLTLRPTLLADSRASGVRAGS